jgi:hypothetical protein
MSKDYKIFKLNQKNFEIKFFVFKSESFTFINDTGKEFRFSKLICN